MERGRQAAQSEATRSALVEAAASMFAERGYEATSMRDICRRGGFTTGALYGHFRNKADLLAAVISRSTALELESRSVLDGEEKDFIAALTRLAREYPSRRELRALILQGAAAAHTDDGTKQLLRDEQEGHLADWQARYEEVRDAMGIDPGLDMRAALLYTWAAELGLGVIEALGVEAPEPELWSDVQNRVARSFTSPGRGARTSGGQYRGKGSIAE